MPNRSRRPARHHSPELQELIAQAPEGVRWHKESWLTSRVREDGSTETRRFSGETIGCEKAFKRAIAWREGKKVPDRYDGMDLSRVDRRKLTIYRRVLRGSRRPLPRFEIQIERSKGCSGQWMRIYLGTSNTLTQARLDSAVATLHLRMERFRDAVVRSGREKADKGLEQVVVLEAPAQRQILLADVLAWTGKGVGVSYTPRASVDPSRTSLFQPELDAAANDGVGDERSVA